MQFLKSTATFAWIVIRATASGVIITLLAGSTGFLLLSRVNARFHPEIPWAAVVNLAWVGLMAAWLGGSGWPSSTRGFRRFSLRLWRPPQPWTGGKTVAALMMALGICVIYGVFIGFAILVGHPPPPDLRPYPTTALRFSAIIMGALLSGVGEEMAFRGYMQSQLERYGPVFAILVTSVVFMLAHAPQDLHQFSRLAVGYLVLGLLWGGLAWRTGSILPGMVLHVLGDLSAGYFVYLGGRGDLLFAS
jgi:membrane protease YdiL (CAAX protease family)